ncbi:MAG TPA: adenosine kinase [Bacteroidetes bacterium]|nr:adenosine kinase [Bacteroidota bacterium]
MKKILGIGNALVDVMTPLKDDSIINQLGFEKGSMTLVDEEKSREIKHITAQYVSSMASGGSVANTMHGISKMRAEGGFIGAIGDDTTGKIFEKDMKSAGVKTYLSIKDDDTGTAVAMISRDSERTFATHLGAAEKLMADDLKRSVFTRYDYLYLEGYLITNMDLVERACVYAKEEGLKVAIDLASFNVVEEYRDNFSHVIGNYADIIFANEYEAKAFTGKDAGEALNDLAGRCEIAVVKTGAKGSLIDDGTGMIKIDALDVDCIDSTGAGDLYAAGFLYGLANNTPLDKCGFFGTLLASYVIQGIGPKINIDKWPGIREEINEKLA